MQFHASSKNFTRAVLGKMCAVINGKYWSAIRKQWASFWKFACTRGVADRRGPGVRLGLQWPTAAVTGVTRAMFGRPFVKRFALCYRSVVCQSWLSCLSVCDFVLDGDPATLPKRGLSSPPQFSAHFYCGQTAWCIKMPLGMELQPRGLCVKCVPSPTPKFSAHVYYSYCDFVRTLRTLHSRYWYVEVQVQVLVFYAVYF